MHGQTGSPTEGLGSSFVDLVSYSFLTEVDSAHNLRHYYNRNLDDRCARALRVLPGCAVVAADRADVSDRRGVSGVVRPAAGPDRLIALGKERDQARACTEDPLEGPPPPEATPREANRYRLHTSAGRALYKRRGATVEPGIGNVKKIIDRFSRRGLDNATNELHLAAIAFNLKKIHRAAASA